MDTYFLIYNGDGDTMVIPMTEEEVLSALDNGEYTGVKFMQDLPRSPTGRAEIDTNYWNGGYILIRGRIVSPSPVEVTTKWGIREIVG